MGGLSRLLMAVMVGVTLVAPPVGSLLYRFQIIPRVIAETTLRRKRGKRRISGIVVLERAADGTVVRKSTCLISQKYDGVLHEAEVLGVFVSDSGGGGTQR
jgi:hypothetical protein